MSSVIVHNDKIVLAPNGKALNMQSYIDLANAATGETDTTLLNALSSLIDPYADINASINNKGVSGTFLPSEMAAAIDRIEAGSPLPSGITGIFHGTYTFANDTQYSRDITTNFGKTPIMGWFLVRSFSKAVTSYTANWTFMVSNFGTTQEKNLRPAGTVNVSGNSVTFSYNNAAYMNFTDDNHVHVQVANTTTTRFKSGETYHLYLIAGT